MVNNTSYLAFNTSLKISPSKAEGIALCSSFILTSVFSVAGNSLALFLFAVNKKLLVYVLRIPEFRQALGLCPLRRGTTRMERKGRGNNMTGILTPSSEVKTFGKDSRIQQGVQFVTNEDIAEDVLDTEL
ncbi:hypothetical protein AWC38_SpisGene113 [Stylophora pistillata]|uniref:Uncharacterized protein n=1 Tax=Stylophora pistillata TaxID=50429 RepID=A0A2B4T1Q0_STYPI|nr:hypothetical protein AWC38_SpisGene113 [Stylophora pistillata]